MEPAATLPDAVPAGLEILPADWQQTPAQCSEASRELAKHLEAMRSTAQAGLHYFAASALDRLAV